MPPRTHRKPFTRKEARELSELLRMGRTVRGATPQGHPTRIAGETFAKVVTDRRVSVDPPYTYFELGHQLEVPDKNGELGPVDPVTLRFFLGRHNGDGPESQGTYTGKSTNTRHRTETHFACGDPIVKGNIWHSNGRKICKKCQSALNKQYQASQREKKRAAAALAADAAEKQKKEVAA